MKVLLKPPIGVALFITLLWLWSFFSSQGIVLSTLSGCMFVLFAWLTYRLIAQRSYLALLHALDTYVKSQPKKARYIDPSTKSLIELQQCSRHLLAPGTCSVAVRHPAEKWKTRMLYLEDASYGDTILCVYSSRLGLSRYSVIAVDLLELCNEPEPRFSLKRVVTDYFDQTDRATEIELHGLIAMLHRSQLIPDKD